MSGRPAVLLDIGETGVIVRLPGGEEIELAFGRDRAGWRALPGMLASRPPVVAVVSAKASFALRLPDQTCTTRQLRRAVAKAAPVSPRQLAWTRPRQIGPGRPEITLVRRTWLNERLALLERETGQVLQPVAAHDLAPFLYRSPAARRRLAVTLAFVALPLLQLAFISAMPDWRGSATGLTGATSQSGAGALAGPGLAASVAAVAANLPPGTTIAALARDRAGILSIDVKTPDPEGLHNALPRRELAPGLAHTGKDRLEGKAFRMTFSGVLALPVQAATARGALLHAKSPAAAAAAATSRIRGLASGAPLTVEALSAQTGPDRISVQLAVSGPQAAVLAYANALESSSPVVRLLEWRLVPDASGTRLSGTAVAPWRRGS